MKTKKAMTARFKVSGTGKLMRHKQGRRHKLTKKSSQKKRALGQPVEVTNRLASKYKRLMRAS